ncbi:nuclear transport factor 2 family protein [Pseudomonas sp. 273]|uniref:nuclear transport factor 2 family protein n=1 Tax=Pseudomonas sp. 273 TaxID=75692 RepID=UPI0023D8B4E5|nr:nuclear transport factor 2 family protein [Pseudomonas sp. 273]
MKLNKFAAVLAVTAMALGAIAGAYAADASAPEEGHVVDRQSFEHYLALFNQKNPAAFEKYYAPNVRMSNGGLVFNSIPEVEAHYRKIWGRWTRRSTSRSSSSMARPSPCNCS